jgi:hypothetical protein
MNSRYCITFFDFFSGCITQLNAQAGRGQEKPLPLDTAVRTGKLANGFTYYIRHNEEPKGRVLMYLVNKAGSVLEDEDQRGLAHFTEHMSFGKDYPTYTEVQKRLNAVRTKNCLINAPGFGLMGYNSLLS